MTSPRFLSQAAIVLLCAASLVGCSSTKKPQPAQLANFTPTLSTSIAWKTEIGRTPQFEAGIGQFSPAVSGESVYAASAKGSVSRIDLANGKQVWRVEVGAPIVAGVATGSGVSSGMAAVITDRADLVLIESDGKIVRRIALGGVANEIPVLAGATAVVRFADNRIAGFDVSTGTRRWVLQRTLPPLVLFAQSGMLVAPQPPEEFAGALVGPSDVLVNLPGGRFVWLDAATGGVRWESQVVTPRGSNEVERIVDLLGAPSSEGADVCMAAYQTMVSCFSAQNGRRLWSRDLVASSSVTADPRFVFVADDQSRLHALSRQDGTTVWTIDTFQLRGLSSPISWGRALWVADRFGFLHALAREDGKQLARISLDGGAISGAIRATRMGLILQTQGGQLMLIRAEG